eukprot:4651902-Amphidinium_carterae.1
MHVVNRFPKRQSRNKRTNKEPIFSKLYTFVSSIESLHLGHGADSSASTQIASSANAHGICRATIDETGHFSDNEWSVKLACYADKLS